MADLEPMPHGLNALYRKMFRLAKDRTGMTWFQMAQKLKMGQAESTQKHRIPGVLKNAEMKRICYPRYRLLCRMAGIPRPVAIVLWAKACLPEEDREVIGLVRKKPPRKEYGCDAAFELTSGEFRGDGKIVPDDPAQCYSGMKLQGKLDYRQKARLRERGEKVD